MRFKIRVRKPIQYVQKKCLVLPVVVIPISSTVGEVVSVNTLALPIDILFPKQYTSPRDGFN